MTDRQQVSLDVLLAAGVAGATANEVGAAWCAQKGKHAADETCQWCPINGRDVLKSLRKKKLVKQRRDGTGTWVALNLPTPEPDASFGEFPEGY